jgi:hypothetical protein
LTGLYARVCATNVLPTHTTGYSSTEDVLLLSFYAFSVNVDSARFVLANLGSCHCWCANTLGSEMYELTENTGRVALLERNRIRGIYIWQWVMGYM